MKPLILLALMQFGLAGCGAASESLKASERSLLARDLAHTRKAGQGPRFRPSASTATVAAARPVGTWRCRLRPGPTYGAHVELFAVERGIVVPAGIGVSAPVRRGPRVVGGRCLYPVHTADPTGVVRIEAAPGPRPPRLGELFALWGQSLTPHRLGAFAGRVTAFLNGRRWHGDPAKIPLHRHAQIVVELGGFVPPHAAYRFPPGL